MNYKKLSIAALSLLLFQGCVSKNLSDGDVIVKAMTSCPKGSDVSIITIPSRGALADTSVKTTHNDGGFLREFIQQVEAGSKNIAVQSSSEQKLEAIVANALSGIKDGKLKGISLCLIGISKSEELVSQATKTGATLTMHK
jgi:allantoicase